MNGSVPSFVVFDFRQMVIGYEPHTPTRARKVPMKFKRWNG